LLPPLESAIQKEAGSIVRKVQEYFDRDMKQDFGNL
jgi:hypothetical protein